VQNERVFPTFQGVKSNFDPTVLKPVPAFARLPESLYGGQAETLRAGKRGFLRRRRIKEKTI
jgi:hypothetical protein